MFYKKIGVVLVGLFLMFLFANSTIFAEAKNLNVVMDDNYPPYVFRDASGKLCGITIDQWALWEKKTGIKVHITGMAWGEALKNMQSGNFDVIDTIFFNSERAEIYDFTSPYATLDAPIFFNKNIMGIEHASSLHGFKVGVKKGDNAINILQQYGITELVEFDNYADIIRAAKTGKIVVFVMDKPPALYYLYQMGIQDEFRSTDPMYSGQFHRAVKRGNAAILEEVKNGFDQISDEKYRAIDKRWMGSNLGPSALVKQLSIALSAVCIVVLVLSLWNWLLKKRVADKTKALTLSVDTYKSEIIKRIHAEKEAAASREFFDKIINAIGDPIFVKNRHTAGYC